MKLYSIFDDFGKMSIKTLEDAGMEVTVHPSGVPRPDNKQMKALFKEYDGVIIGTSQKMGEEMFDGIETPRIIATASVGLDHIRVPENKKGLITVLNTPKANAQSVAEYVVGCALTCCKRLAEGKRLYMEGKDNKKLVRKPEDLYGKMLGVVGAGNISKRIMEYGRLLGMEVICWTARPEKHKDIENLGVRFVGLDELLSTSDVISVNLPNNEGTKYIISEARVGLMKEDAIFISVSRKATVDVEALFEKAKRCLGFYVCLDLDVDAEVIELIPDTHNVMVTPHIGGGTVATRKRMFQELADQIVTFREMKT